MLHPCFCAFNTGFHYFCKCYCAASFFYQYYYVTSLILFIVLCCLYIVVYGIVMHQTSSILLCRISIFGRFYCLALMILLTLISLSSVFIDATVYAIDLDLPTPKQTMNGKQLTLINIPNFTCIYYVEIYVIFEDQLQYTNVLAIRS